MVEQVLTLLHLDNCSTRCGLVRLAQDRPRPRLFCCTAPLTAVTRLTVLSAANLQQQDRIGSELTFNKTILPSSLL